MQSRYVEARETDFKQIVQNTRQLVDEATIHSELLDNRVLRR
jgi:hypothetical protein